MLTKLPGSLMDRIRYTLMEKAAKARRFGIRHRDDQLMSNRRRLEPRLTYVL